MRHTMKGQLALSLAGRDKNRIFMIVQELDENYVFIADGQLRKIDNPKRKKLKHLKLLGREEVLPATNRELESLIKSISLQS
ncbi:MAG: hypothetical protein E7591_03830 [Ruminococcaceae bacterium]|nr:hypothetical protein [Oscillospiraceae bacterium]